MSLRARPKIVEIDASNLDSAKAGSGLKSIDTKFKLTDQRDVSDDQKTKSGLRVELNVSRNFYLDANSLKYAELWTVDAILDSLILFS